MKIAFNEERITAAKKILALNHKRNKYKNIFDLLKDDIFKLVEIGLNYNSILELINSELQVNIKYHTFFSWINKNIKQQNRNSNLNNNFQKKDEKQNTDKLLDEKVKNNFDNKETREDKWWRKEIEKAVEGMKEAALRR